MNSISVISPIITLMSADNGYILSYPNQGSQKTYIFNSLQETFDFIARLYNDVEYFNEQLESVRHYQNEITDTGNSLTV